MNRLIFILLALLATSGLLHAESYPITDVTVYRAGATVTRTGSVTLTSGDNLIEIGGLPYNLDLGTTQVFLDPSIKVLSIRSDVDSKKVEQSNQLIVRNNKSMAIEMELYDQLPLSTSEKIVVDEVEVSDAELKEETGLVTWKVNIPAKQKLERTIKYEVEQPKGMNVGML